jgi:hypothetical protein
MTASAATPAFSHSAVRRALLAYFLRLILVLSAMPGVALAAADAGASEVHLHLFWSLRCPHCLTARPQIQALANAHLWLQLHDHEITRSPADLELFATMAAELGAEAQAVPTLFYCGRMEEGWDDSPAGQAAFLARLSACREGGGMPDTVPETPPRLTLPLLGDVDTAALSLPALTLLLAGLDAFNPCAFFVLLFLLSLLVHQRQRRRMLVIGGVFVVVSGLMYFAFMAAWLNLFLIIGSLPWITAAAGLLAIVMGAVNIKDFAFFRRGVTLSIADGRKAEIFRRGRDILNAGNLPAMLAATLVLAITANFYELLCTAGFPMLFTRLLTLHGGGSGKHYLYLALYNAIYVLPLLFIVLAFVRTMGARRLTEREGRLLKLLSGLMMLGLGAVLLVAPEGIGDLRVALALPVLALALTWLAARLTRPR